MLEIGQSAPDFTLPNEKGNTIQLSDYKGKKIVLFFYPKDDTPGCTKESIGFSEQKSTFEKNNTLLFGISKDSVDSHLSFCQKHNLNVTLLSDPEKTTIENYGVWQEKKNYGKTYMGVVRTTVLINEEGKVQRIWKNVRVNGHVEAVLEEVQS